jgi:hypothetical protein
MGKYSKELRKVRLLAKTAIPEILKKIPMKSSDIIEHMRKQYPDLCDDSIKCECRKNKKGNPEWKHQIRWALEDLKYSGNISYSKETKFYEVVEITKQVSN